MNKALSLLVLGAVLLAGCDIVGSADSVTAPSASVQVTNLPAATGPTADLFMDVQDVSGRSYFRSATRPGVLGTDVSFDLSGLALPSATMPLYVAIYDFEGSYQDSRMLARSARFSAEQIAAGTTLELGDGGTWRWHGGSQARFTITRTDAR